MTQVAGGFTIQTAMAIGEGIIKDPNLEKVIRETIDKPSGDLTTNDLANLTKLDAKWRSITDLSGLEYATKLEELDLSYNQIIDISKLSYLTSLKYLHLRSQQKDSNSLIDISPLANLRQLLVLDIRNNKISNLSSLSQLTNMKMLYLSNNNIVDISPIANLVNLQTLELNNNQVENISYLEKLTRLTWLDLGANKIWDISILNRLTNLSNLYLGSNSIESIAVLRSLSNLKDLNLGVNPLGAYQENLQNQPSEVIKLLEDRNVNVKSNLIVTAPIEKYVTNVDKVTISGRAKLGGNLYLNGVAVSIDSKGNYNKEIILSAGENIITLEVKDSNGVVIKDSDGKNITLKRNIYYDKYSLSMTVFSPANGLIINKDWILVEGKADKGSNISVMVNGNSSGLPVTADNEGYFTKKVNIVSGENNLIISASKEGSSYSRSYRKVYFDNTLPSLTVAVEKTLTNQSSVIVTGTAEIGSIVKVNGVITNNTEGRFEKIQNLSPGSNTITVTATDPAGNTKTETVKVTYDNIRPTLKVLEPLYSYDTVNTSTLKVSGIAEIGSTVKINGIVTRTNSVGSFNEIIELENGNNNIIITATDSANNITEIIKRITSLAPSINSPVNNFRTNLNSVNIVGKATVGSVVKVNNVVVEISNLGNFSKEVSLLPGINLITVAGETEIIIRKVIYDNISNLTVNSIKDNQRTNKERIDIAGIGERGGYVTIKVNNIDTGNTTVDNQDKFSKPVSLTPGNNIITITAVDDLGNTTTTTRNIFYDNIPPILTVTGPIDNLRTNQKVTVVGTAELGSIVKVNGITITNKNGIFNYDLVLQNGDNNIIITSTDDVGNVTTVTRKVNFDNIPPSITLNSPKANLATSNDTINVEGFTEKGTVLKLNNVIVNLDENGRFNKLLNLSTGNNLITITAIDSLGNTTVIKRNVILDRTPPVGYIATPINSKKVNTKPTFKVSWFGKDSGPTLGIASYDVQYMREDSKNWIDWKVGTTLTSANFTGVPGHTYFFRIRARDKANNLGDWTNKIDTLKLYKYIVPYDDRNVLISKKIGFKGSYRSSKSNNYLGSLTYSTKANDSISYRFYGDEVGLLIAKNNKLSKAKIYIDGKYLLTVDAYSKSKAYRQIAFRGHWRSMGYHTITIVNLGTKGRNRFEIDGLIIGKTPSLNKQ